MYDEAGHEEECSRQHVAAALLRVDLEMGDKVAQQVGGCGAQSGQGDLGGGRLASRQACVGLAGMPSITSL